MLAELYIKNIALIDELRISFHKGFNVLTGETGAGKSIIVDSIALILGGRADKELIKSSCASAYVEAVVADETHMFDAVLEKYGIPVEETLIFARELSVAGKSAARVNGRTVPVSVLKDIAFQAIQIYGQNEHQNLMNEERHIEILDSCFADELEADKLALSASYNAYKALQEEASALQLDEAQRSRMMDMLDFQIQEISAAELKEGEEENLIADKTRMLNAEKIAVNLETAKETLSHSSTSAMEALAKCQKALSELSRMDERFQKIENSVNDAYYTLEDASYELSAAETVEFNEFELNRIEDRLAQLKSLKRKYGATVEDVLAFLQEAVQKREALIHSEEAAAAMAEALSKAKNSLEKQAKALSQLRKKLAKKFEAEMVAQLCDLGMGAAQFEVRFTEKDHITEEGMDHISFWITVNRGEPLKPLAKVVSGGEASRIMLALKTITAAKENIGTLIFDEVDTGISGKTAHIVAEKIARIAHNHQVICVTHLPHIAAVGDANYLIEKYTENERTYTSVHLLSGETIAWEIARLSGGLESEKALQYAEELLENARKMKAQLLKKC